MRKDLLPQSGHSYKACLHTHTTLSDGTNTPEQIKALYRERGYAVVAYTDHDVLIDHSDLCEDGFLALNGYELEVSEESHARPFGSSLTCHMCFIAKSQTNLKQVCYHKDKYIWGNALQQKPRLQFDRDDYLRVYSHEGINDMFRLGRENGFYVIYNHPAWSMESYPQYSGYTGMDAMEIFNTGCWEDGFEEYNGRVYDDLLRQGKRIACIAADDTHRAPFDAFGGWIVLRAAALTYPCIIDALERSSFYASTGPDILALWIEDDTVHVKTSPVHTIRMYTGARHGGVVSTGRDWNRTVEEAAFRLRPNDGYFRIDAIDEHGQHAFSNAYWLDTL